MTQTTELTRVSDKIGPTIIRFFRKRIGQTFHAEELRRHVTALHPGIAPDSPGRIMRMLRHAGKVDYVLTSRSGSEYFVVSAAPEAA